MRWPTTLGQGNTPADVGYHHNRGILYIARHIDSSYTDSSYASQQAEMARLVRAYAQDTLGLSGFALTEFEARYRQGMDSASAAFTQLSWKLDHAQQLGLVGALEKDLIYRTINNVLNTGISLSQLDDSLAALQATHANTSWPTNHGNFAGYAIEIAKQSKLLWRHYPAPAQDSEEYRGVIGADVVAGVGAGVAQTIYDYLDSGSVNWERTKNRAISVGIGGSVGYGVSKVFSWAKGILGW